MKRHFLATALISCALVLVPAAAHAGSDGPVPYTVDEHGVTLPTGATFPAYGHVNLKTSQGGKGIHFDPNNNHPGGQWVGESFIPWSAFGLVECETVDWVQVHGFNEHYGEGGQPPVVVGDCTATPPATPPAPEPTPEPEATTPESVPELAETGLSTGESWLLILALLFLVAGATFSAWSVRAGEWSDDDRG